MALYGTATMSSHLRLAALALAALAAAVAAYLTATSLATGVQPLGCGADSGCAEVMASAWSRVAGVPVSAPALGLYLVVLASLLRQPGRLAAGVLLAAGVGLIAAAGWFVYLQAAVINAWCPWCLVSHGLGVALAILILVTAFGIPALSHTWKAGASALGAAAVAALALTQALTPAPVHRIDLFDIALDLQAEPRLGPADATHRAAIMVDYACPRCRATHQRLLEAQAQLAGDLAIIILPVPMNPACNPAAPAFPGERFAESCELARLALAVHRADPAAFAAFDAWLFEPELPRTAADARAHAAELVGEPALAAALDDPALDAIIERNVDAYARSDADRIPVTAFIGTDARPIVGQIDATAAILDALAPAP